MHTFLYPSQDSTIYNDYVDQNSGKDEILEISKTFVSSSRLSEPYYSRALLKFDLNWISQSIEAGTIGSEKFYLNLKLAWGSDVVTNPTNLYIYPVSQSWVEGFGKRLDTTIRTTGTSWIYRDSEVTSSWNQSGADYISSSIYEVTASMFENENTFQENGNYIYELADIRADVTDIVKGWLSGSIENHGFIIKRSIDMEQDAIDRGKLNFYSMDSHTINIPKLEILWDDYSYNTGSSTEIDLDDAFVYVKNLHSVYNNRSKTRIRIGSREAYPTRSFATSNPYTISKHLPSESYYSIKDASTEETLIPFGGYSKISCDSNGNYFDMHMDGFFPERYYRIEIKSVSSSIEEFYDDNYKFKVVR